MLTRRKIKNNFIASYNSYNVSLPEAMRSHVYEDLGTSISPAQFPLILWQSETGGWKLTQQTSEQYCLEGNRFKALEFDFLSGHTVSYHKAVPKYVRQAILEYVG